MDFFLSLPVPNHTADTNYTYILYNTQAKVEKKKAMGTVYSDRIEHSARRFRADLPPFQSNLSALLSTRIRKSSAYLSGYECNDRFSIPPESLFRAL